MTTRRGEPIETERVSVEDLLRPLAEWEWPGQGLDTRFDALRGYELIRGEKLSNPIGLRVHTIDASLGAIVRAAAACGLDVVELYQWPGGAWGCTLRHYLSTLPTDPPRPKGTGATPEEAAARALVAAKVRGRREVTQGHATLGA